MIGDHPDFDDHERVSFLSARVLGAPAIIAVHRSVNGVGGGGVRFRSYAGGSAMLADALRLSQAMSWKNALVDIPIGGGKTVINGDPTQRRSRELLLALGRHIGSLSGAYIAGPDIGTSGEDMAVIAEVTDRVIGVPGRGGDTSIPTAMGLLHGIRTTANTLLNVTTLAGVSIGVQGAGGVGRRICRLLTEEGAHVRVADTSSAAAQQVASNTGATVVPPESILSADVDILVPCAVGGVLNEHSIPRLRARAICGAANNQIATADDARRIAERGILYAPDYVVSSGGAISAARELGLIDDDGFEQRLRGIGTTLADVYRLAASASINTSDAARRMAMARLADRPAHGQAS
jgi:leucine dehydrogenase